MQAQDSSSTEEPKPSVDNLSQDGLMQRLMKGEQAEPETEEQPEVEPEVEEEPEAIEEPEVDETIGELLEEGEPEAEEEAEDYSEEEEEAPIDLLSLNDPAQIKELADKSKSGLLKRFGELTARAKAAEAEAQGLREQGKPTREIPQEQNPYQQLESFDDIKGKYEELERILETTDETLEEYEDYSNDDVIEVGNQQFTKKQLREANRNARNGINKYLPAQAEHIKKKESYVTANREWVNKAAEEVPAIKDEESEIGKAYKQLVSSPQIKKLKEVAPELGVDVEYILAHAVNSKFGKRMPKVAKGAGRKLKVKPPASPVGAGAAKGGQKSKSKASDLYARFLESGKESDLVAYQIAQRSK